ncbi:MAG: peptidylprolyl isomerase [Proteobacteria bacterium]|nr:peptidylprolyl isomerase [Pseudomonadota bacterium]
MKKYFAIFFLLTVSVYANDAPRVNLHTNFGIIVLELNPSKAPKTVENFLKYANGNFYDDTILHRVIKNYIVQGGGYSIDYKKKPPLYAPIINESDNGLGNLYGTVAMARSYRNPDSATSQFFINIKDNISLNYNDMMEEMGYTVFGKVIEGMDVIEKIQSLKTGAKGALKKHVPETQVIIEVVVVKDVNSAIESSTDTKISLKDDLSEELDEPEVINDEITVETVEISEVTDDEKIVETVETIDVDVIDNTQTETENITDSEDVVELSTIIEPDIPPPNKAKLEVFDVQFAILEFTAEKIPINKIPIIQEKIQQNSKKVSIIAHDTPSQPDTPDPFPY